MEQNNDMLPGNGEADGAGNNPLAGFTFKRLPFQDRKMHSDIFQMIYTGSKDIEPYLDDGTITFDMYFTIEMPDVRGGHCICDNLEIPGRETLESLLPIIESGKCLHVPPGTPMKRLGGLSVIHFAVKYANLWLVKKALDARVDLDIRTLQMQSTVLHISALNYNDEVFTELIAAGADLESKDGLDSTPLSCAIMCRKAEAVKMLIKAGCKINTVNIMKDTPLLMAVQNRSYDCVEALVNAGADANICPPGQYMPALVNVCMAMDIGILKLLLQLPNCDVNICSDGNGGLQNFTALQMVVNMGNLEGLQILLAAGADPNKALNSSFQPLIVASVRDDQLGYQMAAALLANGANVNSCDARKYSALHIAAWNGHKKIVELLLNADAEHDNQTGDKNTPLGLACHGGHSDVVEMLLEKGCNVNNADKDSDTALHYATYNGCIDTVRRLIEHGACVNARNSKDATPLWNAVCKGHVNVVRFLLKYNIKLDVRSCGIDQHAQQDGIVLVYTEPKSPLFVACDKGVKEAALLLLVANVDLTHEDWLRQRHFPALAERDPEFVQILLKYGTNSLSLKRLSRAAVRKLLRIELSVEVQNLEIPQTLKNYLLFSEL